jgi:hypothetical protein
MRLEMLCYSQHLKRTSAYIDGLLSTHYRSLLLDISWRLTFTLNPHPSAGWCNRITLTGSSLSCPMMC